MFKNINKNNNNLIKRALKKLRMFFVFWLRRFKNGKAGMAKKLSLNKGRCPEDRGIFTIIKSSLFFIKDKTVSIKIPPAPFRKGGARVIFQNIKELKIKDIRNIFAKPFNRRVGATAVLVIFVVSYFLQNSFSSQGATFLFTQTDWSGGATANNAAHPGNGTGWNQYASGTNLVSNVSGQTTISETAHTNFSETFATSTNKDVINTTANWNTGAGQVQMGTESAGVNLYEKLNGVLAGSTIQSQVKAGDDYYVGSSTGKFLRYNSVADTATDLTSKISNVSIFGAYAVQSMSFDSANEVVYLGGPVGRFVRYNTPAYVGGGTYPTADTVYKLDSKLSSFWYTDMYSMALDSVNNVLYFAGNSGKFARYNTTSYSGGGTYPTADMGYNLTTKISSFWSTSNINKLTLDSASSIVYLLGVNNFAKYDIASDTATDMKGKISSITGSLTNLSGSIYADGKIYGLTDSGGFFVYDIASGNSTNLTSRISSFWSFGTMASFAFDSTNKVLYLGNSDSTIFVRYNLPTYAGGGTYPTADTAYNLSSKISSFWGGNGLFALSYNSSNNTLYLVGGAGRFARYNTTSYAGGGTYASADTAYDLTAKISSFWGSGYHIFSLAFDSANNALYLGGGGGKLARYNTTGYAGGGTYPTADTAYDLTAKISSFWSTNHIYSIVFDSANNVFYFGGLSGKFARYNTTSYVGGGTYSTADTSYDLTAKISGAPVSWLTSIIYSLSFDSASSVVYLGGVSGKFARYNTTTYSAGGTYPTADTAYSLTTKISSFWSTNQINALTFDSVNGVVYVNGNSGRFGKYNSVSDTATDLVVSLNDASVLPINVTLYESFLDLSNNALYLSATGGRFIRYNTTAYSAGGTYPTANTSYDLTTKISSFWSTNIINSMALDSINKVIYLGGANGKLARYNTASYVAGGTYPTADTAYDLTTKISSFWSTNTAQSLVFDSVNSVLYLGGTAGKFARYNTTSYSGGGTYSASDMAYDFTSKVNGADWNGSAVQSMVVGSGSDLYLGSSNGKFAKYNTGTGVAANLTSKISSFWFNVAITNLVFDSVNGVVYLGGVSAGFFARYNTASYAGGGTYPTADTAYNLTSKVSSFFGVNGVYSMSLDSTNKTVYLGGENGKFIRYNTTSYAGGGTYPAADTGYDLTAKISSFWSTNQVRSSVFDSANNVLYLGGASGKFASYNTTSYAGGGTYPAADTSYDLTAKISAFWSTNAVNSLALDSASKVVYLAGAGPSFARYNTTSYVAGGAYPTADTSYDLSAKVTSHMGGSNILSLVFDSNGNAFYISGGSALVRYSIVADSAVNLRSPDTLSFWSTTSINTLAIDSGGKLYIGGNSGYFAEKPAAASVSYAQSSTLDVAAYNITYATLTKTDTIGTGSIVYQLSNNGGSTWETFTPTVNKTFSSTGSDLRFKIAVSGNATIQDVSISYWAINGSGGFISSKYNTGDAANVLAKMEWSETLASGTDVQFQVRTSADGNTWTAWCGPDNGVGGSCNSGTYFTGNTGTETVDDINSDGANDQWFQYQAFLTSTGINTPTLSDVTATYVVNAPPQIRNNVSATQGSDGLVVINYEVLDPDTTTGTTQNSLNMTLQYCTANCSSAGSETWTEATTVSGDFGTDVAVIEGDWTTHQMVWTPATDYATQYNATNFKVRLKANDSEAANNVDYEESGVFVLDTTKPTLNATTLLLNDSASAITPQTSALTLKLQNLSGDTAPETIYAQFSKDGSTWYGANSDNTLAAAGSWGTGFALNTVSSLAWPWTMTTRSETITVRIKDGYGNIQSATDSNSAQYNATPEVRNTVSASQGSDGLVTVDYEIQDVDTTIGATPNVLNITLQYCTANCSTLGGETWVSAVTATGDGAGVSVTEGSWSAHQIVWTAKTDYASQYNASNFKVRVRADDGDPVNNLDYENSGTFTLDTTDPVASAFTFDHSTNIVRINSASDDSDYEMYVSDSLATLFNVDKKTSPLLNQASSYPNNYSYVIASADPMPVFVGVKDAKGNTDYTQIMTPSRPTNLVYYDISNPGNDPANGEYREFLAWNVITDPAAGFSSYKVYRATSENGTYALVDPDTAIINDRLTNYYLDKVKDADPLTNDSDLNFDPLNPTTYYYKVVSTDAAGNVSDYSATISDAPDGQGGSDTTAPTITNVQVSNIGTTSATITWDTDEMADSMVGYSTDHSYTPQRGFNTYETTGHQVTLVGLLPNTTYHFDVQSEDVRGNTGIVCYDPDDENTSIECSQGSNTAENFTFTTDPGPAISSVAVSSNNTQATVSWITTTDSDSYVVYSNTVTNGALVSAVEVGTPTRVGGSPNFNHSQMITTYNNVPLLSGTNYYFYVKSTDATNQTAIDNNGGNFYSFTTTQDDDAPIISGVNAAIINDNKVAINWTTDEPATGLVNYGTVEGGPYSSSGSILTYDKSHYVILNPLDPNTDYYYTVTSSDINGNSVTSGEYSFTTLMNPEQQHPPLASLTATVNNVEYDLTDLGSAAVFAPAVLTDTSAVIEFTTDQIAMCSINYREDAQAYNPSDVIVETGYNTDHSMHIMSLILDTDYDFIISCADNLPAGQAGTVESMEFAFTTKLEQVGHPSLTDPGDPLEVIASDTEAVVQLPTLNTEATSKLCYDTEEILDVETCPNSVEITTPSRIHSYYLYDLIPSQVYNVRTKVTDSTNGSNFFLSSDNLYFETRNILLEHTNLTDPGDPTVLQKSDTEAVIVLPIANTNSTSRICYSTSSSVDVVACSGGTIIKIDDETRLHYYHLTGLTFGTTYYFKTQIYDSEYYDPDYYNIESDFYIPDYPIYYFTSAEQTFITTGGVGSGTDSVKPEITNVSAKVNSGESVTVTWTTNEPASSYVKYGIISGTYTDMAGDPVLNSNKTLYDTAHTVIINGLIPGIKYYFTALSTDQSGNIAESSEGTFTTGTSSSLSSINITSANLGEALVTWNTSEKTSSLVEYGTTNLYGQKKEDTSATTDHSVTVNGLTTATLYHLRVGGKDADGQRYSSGDYTFTPKSPPQIGVVSMTDITEHGVTIAFGTDFPTDFNVTYTSTSDANDSGSKGKPDFSVSHALTLDNLKPGTTYSLKIQARDEQGNSSEKIAPNFTTGKDENAPEIKQTRTESALAQNDKVQTIISWETNELSKCSLLYREGASGEEREYKLSDRPTISHVAVVTSFKSGTVYYFKVKSIDEAGNESISSEYALLTPQKKENIVQIIVNNFQDIFSWTSQIGG